MNSTWNEAAAKYHAEQALRARQMQQAQQGQQNNPHNNTATQQLSINIKSATAELQAFLRSEDGRSALALLSASGRHIIFGEENEGGGFASVYFLDGNGLQMSVEAAGQWTAYSKNVPQPELEAVTAEQAVDTFINLGHQKPTEIMNWLHAKLDAIASKAPPTKA